MSADVVMNIVYSTLYAMTELTIILIIATSVAELVLEYVDLSNIAQILSNKNRFCGMVLSVIFGLITPFCPCATVPVAVGMNEAKLPFGVTMCFLFSSPVLSFAILGGIASVFNVKVMLLYLSSVSLLSIFTGYIMESLGMIRFVRRVRIEDNCKQHHHQDSELSPWRLFKFRLARAFKKGMYSSRRIIPYIALGCIIGAIFNTIFTDAFITEYILPHKTLSVVAVTLLGIPLSIDPAAAISVCALLHSKGIPTGTILAFFTGAIGASVPMFMLLSSIYKIELIVSYVIVIFINIISIGFFFNMMG